MKVEIKEYHNTLNMEDVVAVINKEQWLRLCALVEKCKPLGEVMLDILGNDKLFTEEK